MGEPSLAPPPLETCPDRDTLESALASPRRTGFGGFDQHPTLQAKAAVLTYTLAKSQACVDGNKRLALVLLRAFLHINGTTLIADNQTIADKILLAAASDRQERETVIMDLTQWLEASVALIGGEEV